MTIGLITAATISREPAGVAWRGLVLLAVSAARLVRMINNVAASLS